MTSYEVNTLLNNLILTLTITVIGFITLLTTAAITKLSKAKKTANEISALAGLILCLGLITFTSYAIYIAIKIHIDVQQSYSRYKH
jgi:hypothetical protein